MKLRRMTFGLALAAVVVAGCSTNPGDGAGGGSQAEPAVAGDRAAVATTGAAARSAKGSAGAAAEVRLVDLGNRIVRTAKVDLEVGKGTLDETIDRATDVVTRGEGTYVGSSTSVPGQGPASGQVTFRVPVDAFEAILRELKGLGTYRGERTGTEDVTNQYVDLRGQLTAWRAQERVYLRLLGRARSIGDVIAVQNQLQQVQSNIERLQGQVNHLEDQSSFSTIVLNLTEPGAAGAAQPRGRLERAWATAVSGLGVMAAAALVALVWLTPVAVLAGLVLLLLRAARRPRPA
jgi:tetrahydromethanopterin S-methyltransferase subunit B